MWTANLEDTAMCMHRSVLLTFSEIAASCNLFTKSVCRHSHSCTPTAVHLPCRVCLQSSDRNIVLHGSKYPAAVSRRSTAPRRCCAAHKACRKQMNSSKTRSKAGQTQGEISQITHIAKMISICRERQCQENKN